MRLTISAHMEGHALRFVGPGSDEIVATFRTWDEVAAAMRAAREALPQLAATLAKPSLNKEANRGH